MTVPKLIIEPGANGGGELAQLGGKARSLCDLAGLEPDRVPAWFAVSAEVFADALDAAGIEDALRGRLEQLAAAGPDRAAVSKCAVALAPLMDLLTVGDDAAHAIADAYQRLGKGEVAVRSSALDEDGAERSFAGCLDTSLFVRGADAVRAAVAGCWRSAFSERSLTYRAAHGALDMDGIRVAVVVQRMVSGSVSGVLFSADPSRPGAGRALITATWGLGEGVVSGRIACDTFAVDRATRQVVERDIVNKSSAIVRGDIGGTHEVEVAAEMREQPTLSDDELRQLAELGWKIEEAYGAPVNVEWTWSEEGPWLLQARPITTIAADAPAPAGGQKRLWDNSNIIESYHGVTTPLTYSFARRAYAIVYRQAFALLGVPPGEIARNERMFEQMIGLLRGRIYYNLESWYRALQLLPGYKFNAEFMEQMMGVGEKADFGIARPPAGSALRRYGVELPRLVASLGQLALRFARAQRLVNDFFDGFGDAYGDFQELDPQAMGLDDLVATYLEAERRILQRWQAPIVNDILAMIFFGALRKALTTWGLGDASLHNDLLCGEGGLELTEPTRNLLAIMVDVRRDAALCQLLGASSAEEIRARVESQPVFSWLKVRIDQHVARFGDRCVDELKLEQPTLRDDPTFLYAALKGYLAAPPVTVEEMEAREKAIRADAEVRVRGALGPGRRQLFDWLLARARMHVKNRENLRFARTRAFGLVRRLVVAMGERLAAAGRLAAASDVFYLEIGELVAFARGTATTTDLAGLVDVRKREYAGYRAEPSPPERFWTEGAVYLAAGLDRPVPAPHAGEGPARIGDVLTGIGASPGVVRARARLITDPRTASLQGEVLVANRTDPGWVPLFPSAVAVVVERGSVLSHSAIVAREFGIPCVVGIRDALAKLRDGQLIEVDGSAGTLTLLGDD